MNLDEIKKLLKEFPLKRDRESILKLLEGEKLSSDELEHLFDSSLPLFTLVVLNKKYARNRQLAEKEWSNTKLTKFDDMVAIKHLEIIPLIDYHAEGNFLTENGVSYYIKAGDIGILFDTGLNSKNEHPSPLLRNMEALGIVLEDFNYIFISHLHGDHVGGAKWVRNKTFSLSGIQQDLSHVKAFTPVPMNHPTAKVSKMEDPGVIANGVSSIGSIQSPMFFAGPTFEQALAFNIEGKGIVVVVGCGHQGIQNIIDRVEALFDTPIYGIIGGLHLPIPKFPGEDNTWSGLPIYKFIMTRRPPWEPWHKDDREYALNYIKARNPKIVSLSPHDSSIESICAFKETFKEAYTDLKVGKIIKIS